MSKPLLQNPSAHTLYMREWRARHSENKQYQKDYQRQYLARPENQEKARLRAINWYHDADNKRRHLSLQKARYAAGLKKQAPYVPHSELSAEKLERVRSKARIRSKQWRECNLEKARESARVNARKYYSTDVGRENLRTNRLKRKARLRGARTEKTVSLKAVRECSKGICGICLQPLEGDFHYDHIIPLAKGGLHTTENLQLAHPHCNVRKKDSLTYGTIRLAIVCTIVFLVGLSATTQAATVTHRVATASTSNATSYASGSFTPAAGDLLIAFVVASDTLATGTMSDSQSLGFTKITSALKNSSADTVYAFVSNADATASSMTVTFDCTGDAATGSIIFVASVSGMLRTGLNAIAQSAVQANQASGGTPAISFTNAVNTNNPTLGCIGNSTNPATLTPPSGWTEDAAGDTGYNVPATGGEYVFRNSGFTSTTITWGSTSGSAFGGIALEINASAPSRGLLTLGIGS